MTTNKDALDALERMTKTIDALLSNPARPQVFGLPFNDANTIRTALTQPNQDVVEGLDDAMSYNYDHINWDVLPQDMVDVIFKWEAAAKIQLIRQNSVKK